LKSRFVAHKEKGLSHLAQNKSYSSKQKQNLTENIVFVFNMSKSAEKIRRISSLLCGFLVALDLSAVRLYGDDRPITPSASN